MTIARATLEAEIGINPTWGRKQIRLTDDELRRVTERQHVEAWVLGHLADARNPLSKGDVAGKYVQGLIESYKAELSIDGGTYAPLANRQAEKLERAVGNALERMATARTIIK